jgi:predicted peptidase
MVLVTHSWLPAAALVTLLAAGASSACATPADSKVAATPFLVREVEVHGSRHRFAVWVPPDWSSDQVWPGIVFLHGSGEFGDDGLKPTAVGLGPVLLAHPERWPCVVVFPQKPIEDEEWEEREDLVLAELAAARAEFRIDPDRIALTGMSQGGHGTWMLGARHADLWSCLAPVCGYGRARTVARRVSTLPVWAFHGMLDDVVDPQETRRIVDAIRAERTKRGLDPEGASGVRLTLYPDANHNSWDAAYSEADLPAWLLAHRRPATETHR